MDGVEIILALLKGLFGEQEKPADMSNLPDKKRVKRNARGPYQYGDESSPPKTLEEILAEVRGQSATRTQTPSATTEFTPPEIKAEPRVARQTQRINKVSLPLPPQKSEMPEFVRASDSLGRREIKSTLAANWDNPAPRKTKKTQDELVPMDPSEAASELSSKITQIRSVESVNDDSDSISRRGERSSMKAGEMLRALKNAPASTRQAAAREAFIFQEVFGLPRSRKAIRR